VDVSGNVTSYDDFYPFGMTMDGRSGNFGSGDARYKYTTKERDAESGYDYFGARYYDARIGRWMAVDPSAEKYPASSPYVFTMNCPLRLYDPDGKGVKEFFVGLGQAVTYKVSFGIRFVAQLSVFGNSGALGLDLNGGSKVLVKGDLASAPTSGGELTRDITVKAGTVSFEGGGMEITPVKTETHYSAGGSTDIKFSDSKTEFVAASIGPVKGTFLETVTKTQDLTGEITTGDPKKDFSLSVEASKTEAKWGLGICFELSIDMKKVAEAIKALGMN
jgi:RHS repeat-associated protein